MSQPTGWFVRALFPRRRSGSSAMSRATERPRSRPGPKRSSAWRRPSRTPAVSGATQRDTLLVGDLGDPWSAFREVQRLATKRFACSKRQRPRRLGVEQGNLFRLVPSEEGLILNAPLPRWLVHRRSPCQLLPPADRGASLRRICDGTKCQTLGTKIDPRRTARPRYSTSNI